MNDIQGYIFDLDGTIYLGENLIPGAAKVIEYLQTKNKKVLFLTNKTIESREHYVRKLNRLGIKVTLEHILSPTIVSMHYLQEKYQDILSKLRIYVIGEALIKQEFRDAGFHFADTPSETDVVIVSWDRNFHYDHLNFAYQAVKQGADILATNPDRTCPMPGGDVPDCGGMIGAIEGVTGQKITTITGKPSIYMASAAIERMGLEAEQCLMIGDRLETDIWMGKLTGMQTSLVLTGITKKEDLQNTIHQPDYVLDSVTDLLGGG